MLLSFIRLTRPHWHSCESGFVKQGAHLSHLTKPGWSKPYTHSNPTNLALFRRKIALYRFNHSIRGLILLQGGSNGRAPLTLTTAFYHQRLLTNTIWMSAAIRLFCLRQGGYVFIGTSLFVCLFVCRIMQQLFVWFSQNSVGRWDMGHRKTKQQPVVAMMVWYGMVWYGMV